MTTIKTHEEVNEIIQKEFVMIIAKTHSCSICNTILNVMKNNIPNLDQIEQYAIYVDDLDQFRGEHLIFSVPTVLIFSKGKELLRESRYINYGKITRLIEMYQD
jgi:predicted thioredoxin/glutaredoxin